MGTAFVKILKTLSTGEIRWRCSSSKNKCKAYFVTDAENKEDILRGNLVHGHDAISAEVAKSRKLTTQVKELAVDKVSDKVSTDPPRKIIRSVLKEDNQTEYTLKNIKSARRNLNTLKRKSRPPLPRDISETHETLDSIRIETSKKENFLLINDRNSNLVVFTTRTNLEAIVKSVRIYIDGTFTYSPRFFKQFFTIHGYLNGYYIPLIFCLLKDKKSETYTNCFSQLKEHCASLNLNFDPAEIVVDFELAIHNSLELVWPTAKIRGCRFHLSQAWWRKIQSLGLVRFYKDKSSEIGRWLGYVFGLIFVPPMDVGDRFALDLIPIKPESEALTGFSDYLVDHYISEEAEFPPILWAALEASVELTTNACEAFHSRFNRYFGTAHEPNVFDFQEVLIDEQVEVYVKIFTASTQPANTLEYRSQKRLDKMNGIVSRYYQMDDKLHYLKVASHYFSESNKR